MKCIIKSNETYIINICLVVGRNFDALLMLYQLETLRRDVTGWHIDVHLQQKMRVTRP